MYSSPVPPCQGLSNNGMVFDPSCGSATARIVSGVRAMTQTVTWKPRESFIVRVG